MSPLNLYPSTNIEPHSHLDVYGVICVKNCTHAHTFWTGHELLILHEVSLKFYKYFMRSVQTFMITEVLHDSFIDVRVFYPDTSSNRTSTPTAMAVCNRWTGLDYWTDLCTEISLRMHSPKFGNVYYHFSVNCVLSVWPQFIPNSVVVPPDLQCHLLPEHKHWLYVIILVFCNTISPSIMFAPFHQSSMVIKVQSQSSYIAPGWHTHKQNKYTKHYS